VLLPSDIKLSPADDQQINLLACQLACHVKENNAVIWA